MGSAGTEPRAPSERMNGSFVNALCLPVVPAPPQSRGLSRKSRRTRGRGCRNSVPASTGLHPRLCDVECRPRSPFGSVLLRQECAQGSLVRQRCFDRAQHERDQGLSTNGTKGSARTERRAQHERDQGLVCQCPWPSGGSCSAAVSRPKQVKQANSRERVQEFGAC
jgi:hypothetical protein